MQRAYLVAVVGVAALVAGCEKLPNVNPSSVFFYTPISPINAGETTVTFDASGSLDADGSITSYVWNFGDGTGEQAGSAPIVTHVFRDTPARCIQIVYAVSLRTVDDAGGLALSAQNVTVTELPTAGSTECAGG